MHGVNKLLSSGMSLIVYEILFTVSLIKGTLLSSSQHVNVS